MGKFTNMLISTFTSTHLQTCVRLPAGVRGGAFDNTDLSYAPISGCVLYMVVEFFQLSGRHSWRAYYIILLNSENHGTMFFFSQENLQFFSRVFNISFLVRLQHIHKVVSGIRSFVSIVTSWHSVTVTKNYFISTV